MAFFVSKTLRTILKQKLFEQINLKNIRNKYLNNVQIQSKITVPINFKTFKRYCTNKTSKGRHHFHPDIETALNQQVLIEFNASYAYLSMSAFFGRTEVALPGCQGFFYEMFKEETEHAVIFMNYILMRGGHVNLLPIKQPEIEWKNVVSAFDASVEMEKYVKEQIVGIVHLAESNCDYQLADFLSSDFLTEQNESIQKMARLLSRASKMTKEPNGEFLFDRQLFNNYVKDGNLMYCKKISDESDETYK